MTSHHTLHTPRRSTRRSPWRLATAVALAAAAVAAGTGCAPLIVGGAVLGSSLVATDRRTTGTQVEDQSIELKASSRVRELATLGNINVVSYNRMLLITGEVPGDTEKAAVGAALARIENVRSVVNELGIGHNASVGSRGTDTLIEARVKAALVDAKDLHANAYKVVSERGIVYLMGRVSEREATRGAEVSRAVGGVQKVVRVFEILSEEELANLGKTTAAPVTAPTPVPAAGPASPGSIPR